MAERIEEKILFVDDEPRMLASILRQLSRLFNVTSARDAEQALEIVSEKGPIAVVCVRLQNAGHGRDYPFGKYSDDLPGYDQDAPDRLRRSEQRHQGDQRRKHLPLPDQALRNRQPSQGSDRRHQAIPS